MDLIGYVTLEEANTYVSENYVTADPLRIQWEALIDDDKKALLRKSFQTIELLPFTGRKTCMDQPNMFPRWPQEEVPQSIKAAQVENALSLSDTSNAEDDAHYTKLWKYGVSSYSIGNLSESISTGTYGMNAQRTGVVSAVATRLLQPYLGGSYRI